MNKQKLIDSIKQDYKLKRIKAEAECDMNLLLLCNDEKFNSLYTEISQKQLQIVKSDFEKEKRVLINEVNSLQKQIDIYLTNNKIPKDSLTPKYECTKCNDTGIFNGETCSCVTKELNKRISSSISSQINFHKFDDCNKNIMTENDIKTYDIIKMWCKNYPKITKTNINIIGGAGSGKTFLIECVANEMINKNLNICYKTAFDFNDISRKYHMGQSYELNDIIDSDILFIDDLGTEPMLRNITKEYLYNVLNQRQINKKPTFITSNLSLMDILSKYDERIFSRLTNKNLSLNIQLDINDKRMK